MTFSRRSFPIFLSFLLLLAAPIATHALSFKILPISTKCTGSARYNVTILNVLTKRNYPNISIPLSLSPPTVWSQSTRFTALSAYGYATPDVKSIAETGNAAPFINQLRNGRGKGFVKAVANTGKPIKAGAISSMMIDVDCTHSLIGVISMIAPSPDWFVAFPRIPLVRNGRFVRFIGLRLRAFDAGTDSGEMFKSVDKETKPRQNIAPITGKPFYGRVVAKVLITKMKM